jgi:excisionase family DNA binding protein
MKNHNSSKQKRNLTAASIPPVVGAPPEITLSGLLSRAEVAERLGVCCHTIQRLTRKGVLPALRFNKRLIRYTPQTVEAFVKSAIV